MDGRARVLATVVVVGSVAALGAAVLWRYGAGRSHGRAGDAAGALSGTSAPGAAAGRAPDAQGAAPGVPAADSSESPFPGFEDAFETPWSEVDLDAVRAALPDNIYWEMAAPTSDPTIRRLREEERARWNVQYGKVLSGTGTEQEIHDYFEHRQRLSSDYIEFAMYLLEHYVDVLPERDYGLLELAVRLHQARLEEVPRRLAEALERKRRQDALREAWRRDEAAFLKEAARPEGD